MKAENTKIESKYTIEKIIKAMKWIFFNINKISNTMIYSQVWNNSENIMPLSPSWKKNTWLQTLEN